MSVRFYSKIPAITKRDQEPNFWRTWRPKIQMQFWRRHIRFIALIDSMGTVLAMSSNRRHPSVHGRSGCLFGIDLVEDDLCDVEHLMKF
jgi:hypothetical protein